VELCLYSWARHNCFWNPATDAGVRDKFNNQDQPGTVFLCSRGLPQPLLTRYWINEPVELDRCMGRNSVRNKNKIIYRSNPIWVILTLPLKLKLNQIVTRKQCLFLQNMRLSPNYHKLPLGWLTTGREGTTNMIHMWKKIGHWHQLFLMSLQPYRGCSCGRITGIWP